MCIVQSPCDPGGTASVATMVLPVISHICTVQGSHGAATGEAFTQLSSACSTVQSLVCRGSAGARPSSLAYHVLACHLPFASCHTPSCYARAHAGAIFLLLVKPGGLSVHVRVHGFSWRNIVSAASLTIVLAAVTPALHLQRGRLASPHGLPPQNICYLRSWMPDLPGDGNSQLQWAPIGGGSYSSPRPRPHLAMGWHASMPRMTSIQEEHLDGSRWWQR